MSEQNNVERIKIGSENVRKNHRATNQYRERYTMSKDRLVIILQSYEIKW
jgi:hypothetical protein